MSKLELISVICIVLISFIGAGEHKESAKEKVMGLIKDLACFSCRANVGVFTYLMFNPVSVKGIEATLIFGGTVYSGSYKLCADSAKAFVTLVADNFNK